MNHTFIGVLVLILAGPSCPVFADSLVHRFSFNDGTATDSIGKAHGKLIGTITIADGEARFPGTKGDRLELASHTEGGVNLASLHAMTIEAWFTIDRRAGFQRIFDFGDQAEGKAKDYIFYSPLSYDGDSRVTVIDKGTNKEIFAAGPEIAIGVETHVAVTVSEGVVTLFLNGKKVSEQFATVDLTKLSSQKAWLGASLFAQDPELVGSIDEFRIYDFAAKPDLITASFQAGPDQLAFGVSLEELHRQAGITKKSPNFESPAKKYHAMVVRFQNGYRDSSFLQQLVTESRTRGDLDIFLRARGEKLAALPLDELLTSSNVKAALEVSQPNTPIFKILYTNLDRINPLMGEHNGIQFSLDRKIVDNEISELEAQKGEVNWAQLEKKLDERNPYPGFDSPSVMLRVKEGYYFRTQNWPKYCEDIIAVLRKYGGTEIVGNDINSRCWLVFVHSTDPFQLEQAASAEIAILKMDREVLNDPMLLNKDCTIYMDTYANLLYKMGRVQEAIAWEEKAQRIAEDPENSRAIQHTLEQMKAGEKTWL